MAVKMGLVAVISVVALVYHVKAQKDQCSYSVLEQIVLDTSDSNLIRPDRLGATKRAIRELVQIHNFGVGPRRSRIGLCIYGTTASEPLSLNNNAHQNLPAVNRIVGDVTDDPNDPFGDFIVTGFQPETGFARIHLGVRCGIDALNAAMGTYPNLPKLMTLIVLANDAISFAETQRRVQEAKNAGIFVTVVTVGSNFIDINRALGYASSGVTEQFPNTAAFALDSALVRPRSFLQFCPVQLIPPPTTTTRRPTTVVVAGGPCDNCIIINGIGYAEATDCWHYWQCIMQEDGTWLQTLRRTAVGAFWDQNIISQQAAALALCPLDPCNGQPDQTNLPGFDNCRGFILCSGGRTIDAGCCPPGERASGAGCISDPTCTDPCPDPLTTPGPCNLTPNTPGGDQRIYFANDGQITTEMTCGPGTIFDLPLCTCVHDGLDPVPVECLPNPEVDLRFTADGGAIDQSRNGYSITTVNLATAQDTNPSPTSTGYVGVFNGDTLVRISNANSDLTSQFTMRVVYDNSGSQANAAVVANAECDGTQPTISIGANPNNGATGTVVTVGDGTDTVSASGNPGRKTVVFRYDGQNAMIRVDNGAFQSVATGPLIVSAGQTCDGIKLGLGRTQPGFNGNIVMFQLWKCLADPL